MGQKSIADYRFEVNEKNINARGNQSGEKLEGIGQIQIFALLQHPIAKGSYQINCLKDPNQALLVFYAQYCLSGLAESQGILHFRVALYVLAPLLHLPGIVSHLHLAFQSHPHEKDAEKNEQ